MCGWGSQAGGQEWCRKGPTWLLTHTALEPPPIAEEWPEVRRQSRPEVLAQERICRVRKRKFWGEPPLPKAETPRYRSQHAPLQPIRLPIHDDRQEDEDAEGHHRDVETAEIQVLRKFIKNTVNVSSRASHPCVRGVLKCAE